ncbi:hypothetical protein DB35_21070 [Streptomyces abyssalis]|uniref:Uncharacterized protein n=1 Tax=Streptomyces abyssalis TaxID=933944 RepID=A0A1E7JUF2_9ACTN|nr:hypothetical protein [Streptomyces abyssalis]OEU88749.1 hypothetical protein DB35_21070 [Streptomyces abyssalis]OEU93587.1 hypothetical protein AN215_02030 [Streptomyces abyssalis]
MELDEVTDELYGLRPQEFTAARDDRAQRARADGQRELAKQIRALRRPTIAAWASNLLVREQGEQVAPLLRLGEELRGAHRNLDGDELRLLSRRQHQLVNALSKEAERLASQDGVPLGPQAQQEVAQTLHAVLTDPDAAQEWAAGRLSKPLAATAGFDAAAREVAEAPASARRSGKPGRKGAKEPQKAKAGGGAKQRTGADGGVKAPGGTGDTGRTRETTEARESRAAREAARRTAREAADEAHRRRREADAASEEAAAARAAREEAEERAERLRGEMREAEEARKQSRKREREADRAEREARRRAEAAEAAEERARREAAGTGREAGAARGGR